MCAYDFRSRSDASKLFNDEPSVTKQEFKSSTDINNILKKYTRSGNNPFVITNAARFGDFSQLPSLEDAFNYVQEAQESFMRLPARIRSRFNNDPVQLLDFLQNPANRQEAESLGIVEKINNPVKKIDPASQGDVKAEGQQSA